MSPPVTLPLIDHLALRVRDARRSRTFCEQALEPFGVKVVESSRGPGFAIEGGGDFWIEEGEPPAAPVHVAFAAADRATVDKFHRAAVEAGGRDNGAPGLRPQYHAGYYAAFVIDSHLTLGCAGVRERPWRCRDGQAERLATGHEDVLGAVVEERLAGESAIESFEAQARDVEEPQPFVLGCPPERTGSTIVQGDVDSVIADAVAARVRQRRVGMLAVIADAT